jgi:hypothetical protein
LPSAGLIEDWEPALASPPANPSPSGESMRSDTSIAYAARREALEYRDGRLYFQGLLMGARRSILPYVRYRDAFAPLALTHPHQR